MKNKKMIIFLLIFLLAGFTVWSQRKTVMGTVTDSSGIPLPGVVVLEVGTSNGTESNFDGNFSIAVQESASLEFSYVGMSSQVFSVLGKEVLDVVMSEDIGELSEVVVTALGIKKKEQTLTYASSQVGEESLTKAREVNVVNSLKGRMAGVNIAQSGSGVGGSSRVTIRGNSFLGGNNQPLVVVDGVPMDNLGTPTDDIWGNRQIDYGNALSLINPDDVESVSVLKGPAASSLYGSRAGSGVVLVTTKSAKKGEQGMKFSYSSSVSMDNALEYLEMQNSYGQGGYNAEKGEAEYTKNSNDSWGPAFDGNLVESWTGEDTPYSARDNDIMDFLRTGFNVTNTIQMSSYSDKNQIRASLSHNKVDGIVPTNTLEKVNMSLKNKMVHSDNFNSEFSVNYSKQEGVNRLKLTRDPDNIFYSYAIMPRNISYEDLENNVRDDVTYDPKRWAENGGVILNPYFTTDYNTNEDERNRINGFGKFEYTASDFFKIHAKLGLDYNAFRGRDQLGQGVPYWSEGVTHQQSQGTETNVEVIATTDWTNYFKEKGSDLGFTFSVGGNLMAQSFQSVNGTSIQQGGLLVPDFYSLNNATTNRAGEYIREKRINSVFGFGQLSYDDYLFLDFTFRNDWSSALSEDNNSYFYPSVGLSYLLSESLGLPDFVQLLKLRGSYAEVGNDLEPYRLALVGNVSNTGVSVPEIKPNPNIKPERLKSYEVGVDMRFFDGLIGLDLSYYQNDAVDQIIDLPVPPSTGFAFELVNAGKVRNSGVELLLNLRPIKTDAIEWRISVNWSKNTNEIVELIPENDRYILGTNEIQIIAEEGGAFGDLYGYDFKTNEEGEYILNDNGQYQITDERVKLGNFNPDWIGGLSSSFSYHSSSFGTIDFGFLIDIQSGGDIYSATQATAAGFGTSEITAENNRSNYQVTGVQVVDGVETPYSGELSAQDYWKSLGRVNSKWIYDASRVTLREITLGYSLPKSMFGAESFFDSVSLGLFARNVLTLSSDLNGLPNTAFTTSNQQGVEIFPVPLTRSLGFNINVNF